VFTLTATKKRGRQRSLCAQRKKEQYGLRNIGEQKFSKHKIPLGLMLKDLFTTRCGIKCKLRALYLALIHPRRLIYRYFSQDDAGARRQAGGNLDILKKSCDLVSIQNAYPMMVDVISAASY